MMMLDSVMAKFVASNERAEQVRLGMLKAIITNSSVPFNASAASRHNPCRV